MNWIIENKILVYILAFASSLLITFFFETRTKKINYKVAAFISCLPIIFITISRWYVGTDYYGYAQVKYPFLISNELEFIDWIRYDVGFVLLCRLSKLITDTPYLIFIVFSLTSYFFYLFIWKFTKHRILGVFLFCLCGVYLMSLNIMRQMFATSIIFIGFQYIEQKKVNKYLLYCVVASLFHRTALLYIPLYWICSQYHSYRRKSIIAVICFFLIPIFSIVLNELAPYLMDIGIGHYIGSIMETGDRNYRFLLPILIIYFFSKENGFINEFIWVTLIIILLSPVIPLASRVIYMFFPIVIVAIPNLFEKYKVFKRCFFRGVLIASLCYITFAIFRDNAGEILPYRFFWDTSNIPTPTQFIIDDWYK